LRYEEEFGTDFSQVRVFRLSREVLQAISIEKSGFKGMRVLLKRDDYKRKALKVAVSFTHKDYHTDVTPVRRLPDALYPPILRGEYKDFLWMMCDTQAEWELLKYLAHKRLFSAVQHPDEYIHAAVTWSLFSVAGQQLASDLHSKGIPLSAHK
jgi:hypothetical protein